MKVRAGGEAQKHVPALVNKFLTTENRPVRTSYFFLVMVKSFFSFEDIKKRALYRQHIKK